jgi:hypothetical protein
MKREYFLFVVFLIVSYTSNAQENPVKFINDSFTINIDTVHCRGNFPYTALKLDFRFINNGDQVVFIDTILNRRTQNQFITKPGDTTNINLNIINFFPGNNNSNVQKDTFTYINIPFYCENEVYYSKIFCYLKYGTGKLISIDSTRIDITKIVSDFIQNNPIDSANNVFPDFNQIIYLPIKNISGDKIFCTEKVFLWPDNSRILVNKVTELNSNEKYSIPIILNLGNKYRFFRRTYFIIYNENSVETYTLDIFSNFQN